MRGSLAMCGILGAIMHAAPVDWVRLQHGLHKIAHRGPDGEGIAGITYDGTTHAHAAANSRIGFGFRRLAIFDPTPSGDQPMRCPYTGNLLIFNGAIYNFLELRSTLSHQGYRFRSDGDSEVILAAYAEWGVEAFSRFNGMWALALYDAARGEVLLSRDRMGVKPLYYAQSAGNFFFASELRALLTLLPEPPSINDHAAFDFLAGIAIDHTPETMFSGVHSLPPGSYWRIARSGAVTQQHYHCWPTHQASATPEMLRALLADALRIRLRADVPSASLLSGGLDSSLITWLAAMQNTHVPRARFRGAFSYGYHDLAFAAHDETARAKQLIDALPVPISHIVLRADPKPDIEELLALTATQELPMTTPSVIASWRLYKQVRAHGIKVALSGEGADELFAGYTRLYLPQLARDLLRYGRLPSLLKLMRSPYLSTPMLINRLAWHLPAPAISILLRRKRPNVALLNTAFWHAQRGRMAQVIDRQRQPLDITLRNDALTQAMPQILRYADRNSMAAGVELRLPFMDYRLVECALATAREAKLNAQGGKQILRHAFAHVLPAEILAQPKTHGFGNAEQYEVLNMPLAPLLERAPAAAWEYLDRPALTRQLTQARAHPMVWLPVSFLLWMTARAEGRI